MKPSLIKSFITYFLAVASSYSMIACTNQSSRSRIHEPPRSSHDTNEEKNYGLFDVLSPHNSQEGESSELLDEWTTSLSQSAISNELRNGTSESRHRFFLLSEKVLTALQQTTLNTEEKRSIYLKPLLDAVFRGCQNSLNSSFHGCLNIEFFKGNTSMTPLLVSAANLVQIRSSDDLRSFYKILQLGLTFLNRQKNNELIKIYLLHAIEYENLLKDSVLEEDIALLKAHQEITDQLILDLSSSTNSASLDYASVAQIADAFGVWNLKESTNGQNARRSNALLKLTTHQLFQNDGLKHRVQEINESPKSVSPRIQLALKELPQVEKSLGFSARPPKDLHLFLLEGLWQNTLSIEQAQVIWDASFKEKSLLLKRSEAEVLFKKDLLNFAKLQLFLTAREVNQIMIDLFSGSHVFAASDALNEAMKKSVRGKIIWSETIGKFGVLSSFFDRSFRSYNDTEKTSRELTQFFAGLDRNIKLTSTYPSMLVMLYHLARLKFSMQIMTWIGPVKLESGKILDWFFSGSLGPLFQYGDDRSAISRSEVVLAFHYALELGTLSKGSINTGSLFEMLNAQMLGPLREDMSKINLAIKTKYESGSLIDEFSRICVEQDRRNKAGLKTFASSRMPVENLLNYALMGYPQGTGGATYLDETFSAASSFWEADREITRMSLEDNLETIRLEFTPKIGMLELYRDIIKAHFERHKIPNSDSQLKLIESQITPLKEMRKEVYTRIFSVQERFENCTENLIHGEIQAEEFVIRGLKNHFSKVYRAMAASRKNGTNSLDKRFNLSSIFHIEGMSDHETQLGFNNKSYRISRLQVLLTITHLLQDGYTDGSNKVQNLRDKDSIIIPQRLTDFSSETREQQFNLLWQDTEKDFVDLALQTVFDPRQPVLNWADRANKQMGILTRTDTLAALVKAGRQETANGVKQFTVSQFLKSHLNMLKALEPAEMMSYVMKISGRQGYPYLDQLLDDYGWTPTSHDWNGLFDYTYEKLALDRLGYTSSEANESTRASLRVGPMDDFMIHSKTMRSIGEPAFEIPTETLGALNQYYSRRVDDQMNLLTEVMSIAKKLETIRASQPESFPSWRIFIKRPTPTVPILKKASVDQVDGVIRELAKSYGYQIPKTYQKAVSSF